MVRELGYRPHFRGARLADYKSLFNFSFYIALIQLSVVLADKVDTSVLGFILDDPGPANTRLRRRQQAVPAAQADRLDARLHGDAGRCQPGRRGRRAGGLDRIKYDGTRLHIGLLLPVGLLAWIYAGPFLSLWIGAGWATTPPTAGELHASLPDGGHSARALGPGSGVDRAEQDQGDRARGPGRGGGEPAGELLSHGTARGSPA